MNDMRDSIAGTVETYLLSTHDLSTLTPRPLTDEPTLQAMFHLTLAIADLLQVLDCQCQVEHGLQGDRKSTRLNSSHVSISFGVFCMYKNYLKNNKSQTQFMIF